jgi:hypothetical protein
MMKRLTMALCILALAACLTSCEVCDDCAGCRDGCADTQAPAVPTGVASITGDGYVMVYWNDVYEDDVAGYGVYRSRYDDGPYRRIGDVDWDDETVFYDEEVINGLTYFYAVDAYDYYGNESDLSYETVDDTPRPEGWGLQWFTCDYNSDECAIAIRPDEYDTILIVPYDHPWAQYYLYVNGEGLLRIAPLYGNQIQDYGYTDHPDEVDVAPVDGWSSSVAGVEVIPGHTYILRTVTGYYGKVRVETEGPNWIVAYWAFQSKRWSTELAPPKRDA